MSDHGPYQSRLLNFLVPQYRRLVEKADRAIRQIKVAASWAAQVVIYPVYLLLQTTRLAFQQLRQAVRSQIPQLRASVEAADGYDVDTPIGQVLQAALPEELVLTPDLVGPQSPKPNVPQHWVRIVNNTPFVSRKQQDIADRLPPATHLPVDPRGGYKGQVIRGLATELTSKNLVLVTADNQELDIFTVQQQKELQQLIIWQLAKYRRHLRQLATGKRPQTWGKLAKSKTTLLPIRLLGQVMAWVQQGTVAREIDLFGESSLVHQPRTEGPLAEPEAIDFSLDLDSFIASLERGISIIGEGPTAIEGKTKEITSSLTQAESVTDGSEREKQNIFALLGAAIAYFFGSHRGDQHLEAAGDELPGDEEFSGRQRIKNQSRQLLPDNDGQLLGLSPSAVTEGSQGEKPNILGLIGAEIGYFFSNKGGEKQLPVPTEETEFAPMVGQSVKNPIGPHLRRPEPEAVPTGTVKEDWVTWSDRVIGPKLGDAQGSGATAAPLMVATTDDRDRPDRQAPGDNIYIKLAPDWIETAATPSGYVKHPLEEILAWLDRGLLWLEDRALGIWKWFRG